MKTRTRVALRLRAREFARVAERVGAYDESDCASPYLCGGCGSCMRMQVAHAVRDYGPEQAHWWRHPLMYLRESVRR